MNIRPKTKVAETAEIAVFSAETETETEFRSVSSFACIRLHSSQSLHVTSFAHRRRKRNAGAALIKLNYNAGAALIVCGNNAGVLYSYVIHCETGETNKDAHGRRISSSQPMQPS